MSDPNKKRKHTSLTIAERVKLLKECDKGTPVKNFCSQFSVGKSTVYDIIKQIDKASFHLVIF